MTNAQVAAPSLLMLPLKEVSAWLAGSHALAPTFKRRPKKVNHNAQRPGLSEPDPWLVDSVYVIEKTSGEDNRNNHYGSDNTGVELLS